LKIVIQALILTLVFLGVQTGYLGPAERESRFEMTEVTVTAYSPDKAQTQGDPFQMASGKRASTSDLWQLKYVAVSRDLKEKYNLQWGDKIFIGFQVEDLMAKHIKETIDLFMRNRTLAKNFGKRKVTVLIARRR